MHADYANYAQTMQAIFSIMCQVRKAAKLFQIVKFIILKSYAK